ncbi:MAG: TetR/AcrR family transcriptional regulator [Bacteroidetes bacterium]|nr:TetR/AcrR family transcriptional regulator [Bacteroidota bacterium]
MNAKERILQAAQELFFRYGIRSVSMDDIAKHLSISKKTIYRFYKDKDAVVRALMQMKMKMDQKNFRRITSESENVIEEMFNIMQHLGKVISQMNPNLIYDLQKYHSPSWKLFKEFRENNILTMVEDMLVRGMKQGYIRQEISTKILARLRVEQIEMGFNPNVFPPDKFKILEVQLAMLEHFLYGICTLKGHKLVNKHKQIIEEE